METNSLNRRFEISNLFSLGLLALLIAGSAYYLYDNRPCAHPIVYSIGTFDTRFGIGKGDFLEATQDAADLWNKEAGHAVLAYDASGLSSSMPVNLIYDARQQQTNAGQSIDQQESALGAERANVDALQSQYNAARQQLQADKAAGKDIPTLNAEVDALNQMGRNLQTEADALNAKISQVNTQARAYNTQTGKDFNEGEFLEQYGSKKVNLYEFKNHTQLVRVLAHEFGHSLGLDHNTNPNSIMYPVNTATVIALTPEDKAALANACTFSFTTALNNSISRLRLLLPTGQ
jgi:predicted Zn-dependent protease